MVRTTSTGRDAQKLTDMTDTEGPLTMTEDSRRLKNDVGHHGRDLVHPIGMHGTKHIITSHRQRQSRNSRLPNVSVIIIRPANEVIAQTIGRTVIGLLVRSRVPSAGLVLHQGMFFRHYLVVSSIKPMTDNQ